MLSGDCVHDVDVPVVRIQGTEDAQPPQHQRPTHGEDALHLPPGGGIVVQRSPVCCVAHENDLHVLQCGKVTQIPPSTAGGGRQATVEELCLDPYDRNQSHDARNRKHFPGRSSEPEGGIRRQARSDYLRSGVGDRDGMAADGPLRGGGGLHCRQLYHVTRATDNGNESRPATVVYAIQSEVRGLKHLWCASTLVVLQKTNTYPLSAAPEKPTTVWG